jgi:hypothetical protein
MVETNSLLANLQNEKDWAKSAVFTDKQAMITSHNLTLLPDELK